jgi:hypothetical protein
MPTDIIYTPMESEVEQYSYNNYYSSGSGHDVACWTAFRANSYELPSSLEYLSSQYNYDRLGNSTTYQSVEVKYTSNCTDYVNNVDVSTALEDIHMSTYGNYIGNISVGGICVMGQNVVCNLGDQQDRQCRMNVRMQAAFILGACLIIKVSLLVSFLDVNGIAFEKSLARSSMGRMADNQRRLGLPSNSG